MSQSPLILTLKLDGTTFTYFDLLRRQHFPPDRNWIPAHITLFHQLPGELAPQIALTLQELCASTPLIRVTFPGLRFLGRGVAVAVDCPELTRLRQRLAQVWQPWLSRQDQQPYRPHITIQNKVTAAAARELIDSLEQNWLEQAGSGEGLLLWSYQGGPWDLVAEFCFALRSQKTTGAASSELLPDSLNPSG